jgi:PAS domain S-box-containing protein
MAPPPIRVLLIEDEESDYLLTRRLLASCANQQFDLQWADSWKAGIEAIRRCAHDVCLLDFRISGGDGLELLKEANSVRGKAPVILLTGVDDYRLDLEAMELGAADFLNKNNVTSELLERSIRYALVQARTLDELRRRQDELSASELRFRSVVQSASDAIVLADAVGNIALLNKAVETMFGYTEEEILHTPIETLMTNSYRAEQRAGFERFRVTGRSELIGKTIELQGLRKDGTVLPIELSLAAWTSGEGTMFTAVIRDITERRTVAELRSAKNAAETANRRHAESIARLSHDLRGFLQPTIGFTSLLLKNEHGNLLSQDIDFLRRILRNAQYQLRLIAALQDAPEQTRLRLSA